MSRLSGVLNRLRREAGPLLEEEMERAMERRRQAELAAEAEATAEELATAGVKFLKIGAVIVRLVKPKDREAEG